MVTPVIGKFSTARACERPSRHGDGIPVAEQVVVRDAWPIWSSGPSFSGRYGVFPAVWYIGEPPPKDNCGEFAVQTSRRLCAGPLRAGSRKPRCRSWIAASCSATASIEGTAVCSTESSSTTSRTWRARAILSAIGIHQSLQPRQWTALQRNLVDYNALREGIVYIQVTRAFSSRNLPAPDEVEPMS